MKGKTGPGDVSGAYGMFFFLVSISYSNAYLAITTRTPRPLTTMEGQEEGWYEG